MPGRVLCHGLNTWQQSVLEINVSGLALNRNAKHITHSQAERKRALEKEREREREQFANLELHKSFRVK